MHSSLNPIFEKLQKSMIDLLEEIKDQPDSVLNSAPEAGGWSILQVVYHIMLVEEASLAYVKKKLSFGHELIPNAGFKGYARSVYLKSMFIMPFKAKAPDLVSEQSMPEEIRFWEVLKKWKDNRGELKVFLDELPDELLKKAIYKHPFAGKLTPKNMLMFFDKHHKRHRKQMHRVLKEVKFVI